MITSQKMAKKMGQRMDKKMAKRFKYLVEAVELIQIK